MNRLRLKIASVLVATAVLALVSGLAFPQDACAQFFDFTRAIPQKDTNGAAMPGANTTFADGSAFQPVGNDSRSSQWAFRPFGNDGVLSSLGLTTNTLPTAAKELVTTVTGLKPGTNYAVKVLFWDTDAWGVRAGLTYANETHTNTWFDINTAGVVCAELLPWNSTPAIFAESGRTLYAGPVGTATANSSGQVKVYIHDLPTGDSLRRTWYQGVALCEVSPAAPHVVNAGAAGTPFHRGVRGLALSDPQIDWGEFAVGIPKSLEAARGSSIRGVSTGLAADRYDWRTRNNQPRPSTLEFLRYSRNSATELFLGVNMRGLIQPNPAGGYLYYDTNTTTLAPLAADWVRYVNHILPTYRQGDSITNSRDAAILNSIVWSSGFAGDSFDKLLAPGEAAVPLIKYWEIGNEPTVGVTSFSVSNSFTMDATNYYIRYKAVAQAIKAENPGVKVGPTLVNGVREAAQLSAIASDPSLPIDFITYHPYEKMGLLNDAAFITLHLDSISSRQTHFYNDLKKVVADSGRDPEAIEYATTEVNVSNWDMNDTDKEARMAHALGTVETVFTHARLGLVASHYWVWPTHRYWGTEYPVFKAYEKLRDHMGDTLLSTYAFADVRLYTTRDSQTGELAVWILNFSGSQNATVDLKLQNLPSVKRATLLRLQDISGTTSLFSANLAPDMPFGPTMNVDWTTSDLTGQDLSDRSWNLPAATLSVVVIEPGIGTITPGFVQQGGEPRFAVTFRRWPNGSDVHYSLLASDDLVTWNAVGEVQADTSEEVTITDSRFMTNAPRRYFRVKSVSP